MKKIYSFFCIVCFAFLSLNINSATIIVMVGQESTGAVANKFNPASVVAKVGDRIEFKWFSGTHNVQGVSLPSGAPSISSGTMSSTSSYFYDITKEGTYAYYCTFHLGEMAGGFFVTSTVGISDLSGEKLTTIYPNPFTNKITLEYNSITEIDFYNMIGEKISTLELPQNDDKINIDVTDFPVGVYFIRTKKEGIYLETKKIIKTK